MSCVNRGPVIHIGLPKCGSTFLQERVFPKLQNMPYVADNGTEDILAKNSFDDLPQDLVFFQKRGERYCFSHEGLSDYVMSPEIRFTEYSHRHNCLTNLRRIFETEGRFLLQIRRQDLMVQSIFQHNAPSFIYRPEDIFIDYPAQNLGSGAVKLRKRVGMIYFETLDFFRIVERLGPDRVDVLLLEELSDDPETYFRRLGDIMGEDLRHFAQSQKKVNESHAEATRYPQSLGFLKPLVRKLGMADLAAKALRRRMDLSPEFAAKVLRDYEYGNRKLQKLYGLPMEKYGYFV